MPISKTRRRFKQKRSRSRSMRRRKQHGGAVVHFHVYVFTKTELTDAEKAQILDVLQSLYGGVGIVEHGAAEAVNNAIMENYFHNIKLELIKEFVYEKGNHYPLLQVVSTFTIPIIPAPLAEGEMTDSKLTVEEYKIRDALNARRIPFKLVQAQHGLWSQEMALIALERDPSE